MPPTYRPEEVERVIEETIHALAAEPQGADRIADLADAIEAYRLGTYGVAMVLARAAMHPLPASPNFKSMDAPKLSLNEIRARFSVARQRRSISRWPREFQSTGDLDR